LLPPPSKMGEARRGLPLLLLLFSEPLPLVGGAGEGLLLLSSSTSSPVPRGVCEAPTRVSTTTPPTGAPGLPDPGYRTYLSHPSPIEDGGGQEGATPFYLSSSHLSPGERSIGEADRVRATPPS